MAKKKVGVTIDEDLHSQVKSAAPLRGRNVESAYDEALRLWLAGDGTGTLSKISDDSPETGVYNSEIVVHAVEKIAEMGKSMTEVADQLRASIKELPRVASPPKQRTTFADRAAEAEHNHRIIARHAKAIKGRKRAGSGSGTGSDSRLPGTGT